MSLVKIAPAGDRALLVEIGKVPAAELHALAAGVRAIPRVVACIVGQESLYVVFDGPADAALIRPAAPRPAAAGGRIHRITVSFRDEYGPDLGSLPVPRREFLARIPELRLIVRFIGFRGGFGYLDGWPEEWAMPRRPTSRAHVSAGTFAVAGAVAAFYPIASPGGWNLLGRTAVDLEHALEPGDAIEIEPSDEVIAVSERNVARPAADRSSFPLRLTTAPLAMLLGAEDWSRTLRGLSPGGPFDDVAAALAATAVGNQRNAPILESAMIGPQAVAERDLVCSWYGADAEVRVGGRKVDDCRQFVVRSGEAVTVGRISGGLRGYLAAGESLGEVRTMDRSDRLTIRAMAGPHPYDRWLKPAPHGTRDLVCEVTTQLDRVGVRMRALEGLGGAAPANLPSCGMQCGTVQLHPDGSVVVMGPDHPVTGGYLQPMTVMSSERWKLAQLAPGERVRFVVQSLSTSP